MATGTQVVYVCRCPLGDCSKKFGILAKKATEDEAREAVKWHLLKSPYHELSEDDATLQSLTVDIEEWPDANETADTCDEGDDWYQKRKKPRTSATTDEQRVQAAALQLIADRVLSATGGGQHHGGGSSSRDNIGGTDAVTLALRCSIGMKDPTANVMLKVGQLKACIDSLRRAKTAAESACHLCGKAARAFGEEAACIQSCQEVLESYLT